MAGITYQEAVVKLGEWMSADTAVAGNQSYERDGRTLTRADAREIRRNVDYWDAKVKSLDPSRPRRRIHFGVGS